MKKKPTDSRDDQRMPKRAKRRDSQTTNRTNAEKLLADIDWPQLADRLRLARKRFGLSIRDLASRAKLSKTSVVRIESGKPCEPETVASVCSAMGLHLEALLKEFSADERIAIHRKQDDLWYDMVDFASGPIHNPGTPITVGQRKRIASGGKIVPLKILASRLPAGKLLSTEIELYGTSPTRSHPGEEWVYVLAGTAVITIAGRPFEVEAGESIVFRSAEPHSYGVKSTKDSQLPVRLLSVRMDEK